MKTRSNTISKKLSDIAILARAMNVVTEKEGLTKKEAEELKSALNIVLKLLTDREFNGYAAWTARRMIEARGSTHRSGESRRSRARGERPVKPTWPEAKK